MLVAVAPGARLAAVAVFVVGTVETVLASGPVWWTEAGAEGG